MRIVVVTIEPPDPFGNAAARWFYVLLRGLVERGHDVTMISSSSDRRSRERAEALFPEKQYDLKCFAAGENRGLLGKVQSARQPFSYVFSQELRRTLQRSCAAGFDVLHLEHLWSGWLGWRFADRALLNVHYLYSSDFAGTNPSGLYDRLRRLGTFAAERRILNHYPNVAGLTDRLARDIRKLAPNRTPGVLPLGIDPSLYPFSEDDPTGPPTVGIIGNFSWTPTYRAAVHVRTELWPRVKAAIPDARLLIVGRDAVRRLGSSDSDAAIEIVENVPEIVPYFRRLHVLLYAPAHGSGTKVKVQESMALGVPVVTNVEGGEGIPGEDGKHWGFANDDQGLAERAIALLSDGDLRRRRRIAARALLEQEFGPERTVGAVLSAYTAIGTPRSESNANEGETSGSLRAR